MYVTFDYVCLSCGYQGERFVKKVDAEDQHCYCKEPLKKLLAAPKTHFRFADTKLKK